jgi:hypothetical protein
VSRPSRGEYPADWQAIATAVKAEAGWCCVRCKHPHDIAAGYMLTVHHLNLDKSDCAWFNLVPLCQRCHLSIQARVNMDRPWVMTPHTDWFHPYVAGYYARKYLHVDLTRAEVEARLPELLELERQFVLGLIETVGGCT